MSNHYNYSEGMGNSFLSSDGVVGGLDCYSVAKYFQRYLLQKAVSVFRWKMPENWAKNYFLYTLYGYGRIAIVNTDKFGVIPQGCGLMGYNVFYQPTNAVIANPLLRGMLNPAIDRECVVLRLQPDYAGIMDLVNQYACLMALALQGVGVNIINSKMAYVFAAEDKATAETFKKLYDSINAGMPAAVVDPKLFREDGNLKATFIANNLAQNYISNDILQTLQTLSNMFATAVGLPNANTQKRERLISKEVDANNAETYSTADMWLEELKEGCRKAREMFPGLDLDVEWRIDPMNGGIEDGSGNIPTADGL